MEKLKSFKGDKTWQELLLDYALYIILIIMIIGVIAADPTFLSKNNFLKILAQASTRGILALGVAGMIVLAGTDLSAGRILGCGAAISASLLQSVTYASRMYPQITEPLPLVLPLLLSIVVCVAFCLLNGFGVAKLHMHAFIISLGTQLIAYGALCLYIDSQKGGAQQHGNPSLFHVWPPPSRQGQRTVKTAPPPGRLAASTVPPRFSTVSLTMANPRPVPPAARDRALSTR